MQQDPIQDLKEVLQRGREKRARRKRIKETARTVVAITGILGALLGVAFLIAGLRMGSSHEDGYSVGTLINVRKEGMLFPRPAATLVHTGEMKGDEFALDDGLYDRAMAFADASARVRVKYIHRYVCWAWNYASCTIITGIEPDPAVKP